MAINIQNIIAALEAKVAAATSATETQELIVIIKSIKAAGQQTIVTYANVAALPTASSDNQGNLAFVADVGKIYYSNSTTWTEVGSGSGGAALNAGTNIVLTPETDGSITISSTGGGAGGSSFDQSLNTTDDVVFDSGLIGNVSIVGNTIGGTDAYGNPDTLIVDGDFQIGDQTTETLSGSFSAQNPNYGSTFFDYTGVYADKFVSGATVTLVDTAFGDGTIVIQLNADAVYDNNYGAWTAPYTLISGSISGVGAPSSTAIVTSGSVLLSVNAEGVSVSTINSTEDLNVNIDSRSTTTISYTNAQLSNGQWAHLGTMYGDMTGKQIVARTFMGPAPIDVLNSFVPGDKLTFKTFASMDYTVTLTSPFVYSMNQNGYVASVLEANPAMMDMNFDTNSDPVIVKTVSTGELNSYTFGTDGTLITPSLVADSALIGDVSIVGNTIAALDSYGNADVLNVSASDVVFDSDLNLSVNTLFETTETISGGGSNRFRANFTTPYQFTFENYDSGWSDAPKFVTGSIITLTDYMNSQTTVVIQLTSDMIFGGMASGWMASFDVISNPSNSTSVQAFSVTVTNTSGSVANYGFDNQGTLTAPAISTDSLLINGSAPSFLTVNQDGSKSIEVPKLVTTNYSGLYWMAARFSGYMNAAQQGKVRIENPGTTTIDLFNSLVVGDKVTFEYYDSMGTMTYRTYTVTVQTAGFNYNMMDNAYILDVVEVNTGMDELNFDYAKGVSVETTGSQEYIFAGDALTASNIIADSALIGDVSIVGNTISGVDAYGLADKLVVDGDLEVTGDITSPTALNVTVGGSIGSTTISNYTGTGQLGWTGTRIEFPSDIDSSIVTLLQTMVPGSRIKFTNYMYGTFNVATVTYVTTTGTGQYEVYVDTDTNSFGYGGISGTSVNGITIEQTIPTATYGFGTNGNFSANQVTVGTASIGGSNSAIKLNASNDTYASNTYISHDRYVVNNFIPGTLIDGTEIIRMPFSAKTNSTSPSAQTTLQAAFRSGDISIIEVTVSAINVAGTPSFLTAKSWKLKAYATKLDTATYVTPIGTPEVLVNIFDPAGVPTSDLAVSLATTGNSIVFSVVDTMSGPAYEWTWGAEISIITTHVLVPVAGGGGK